MAVDFLPASHFLPASRFLPSSRFLPVCRCSGAGSSRGSEGLCVLLSSGTQTWAGEVLKATVFEEGRNLGFPSGDVAGCYRSR